jgi:PAS domain S-box-containing protein
MPENLKINLLIIEDDPNQVFLITESLDPEKFEISTIEDGKEAYFYLDSCEVPPDLILLDYHLPSMDGMQIMNSLKEKGKKYNIVFLTADYSIETAINSISSGALDFIPKNGNFVTNIPAIMDKAYEVVCNKLEKEHIEKALKTSEERFKRVLEASRDGIFEWNSITGITYASPNSAHMLGYKPSEFPSTHEKWVSLVHPEDISGLFAKFDKHVAKNTDLYEAEIRVKTKKGDYKWILERGIVIEKNNNGKPVRIIGTHSDISQRKADEEKIIYSENLYNTAINAINDSIFVIDKNLNILLANQALLRFNHRFGFPKNIIGKKLPKVYTFLSKKNIEQYHRVFNSGKEHISEETYLIGERLFFTETKIIPVFQQKIVVRSVVTIRDITERKNFEKKIMNTIIETEEKERKRFSEDLHDELSSLLSTIKIYINTMYDENIDSVKQAEMIRFTNELINQAIQNSKEIANNLSPSVIKRFGLISAIQSLCQKIEIPERLHIDFKTENYRHKLREDEEISIYRIISELINNTVKHAEAHHINTTMESSGNNLNIYYSDDGKGFDFENMIKQNRKGLGLQNIIMRIKSLNGLYNVKSSIGDGFSIAIKMVF